MPDRFMAADVEGLTTVDVYELASGIGNQFEKMIDRLGPDSVTGLMPMVIRALEYLEELASRSETENKETEELRFAVERLQTEKKLKAEERAKYEKELEQIEESWKSDAKIQHDIIARLQEENRKLTAVIHRNVIHETEHIELVDEQKELQLEVERLKQIVQKQREELRSVEKDLDQKHTTTEMLETRLKQLNRQNSECSRRTSQIERQAQNAILERSDIQMLLHDKERQITILEEKVRRLRGSEGQDEIQVLPGDRNRYTFEEYQAIVKERDELKLKLKALEEELATYKPKPATEDQTNKDDDDEDRPVQGPINREPDEKLYPDRFKKESGIQRLFKHFLVKLEQFAETNDITLVD